MDTYERKSGAGKADGSQVLCRIRIVKQKRLGPPPLPVSRAPTYEEEARMLASWVGERRELDDIVFVDCGEEDYVVPADSELMDGGATGEAYTESLAPVALETNAESEWEERDGGGEAGEQQWSAVLAFSASVAAVVLCGAFAISALHQPRGAASMMLHSMEQTIDATQGRTAPHQEVVLPEVVIVVAAQ